MEDVGRRKGNVTGSRAFQDGAGSAGTPRKNHFETYLSNVPSSISRRARQNE